MSETETPRDFPLDPRLLLGEALILWAVEQGYRPLPQASGAIPSLPQIVRALNETALSIEDVPPCVWRGLDGTEILVNAAEGASPPRRVGVISDNAKSLGARLSRLVRSTQNGLRDSEIAVNLAQTLGIASPESPGIISLVAIGSDEVLSALREEAIAVRDNAFSSIAGRVKTPAASVVVFNTTDSLRPSDVFEVEIPANLIRKGALEFADEDGTPLYSQFLKANGATNSYLVHVIENGALGYRTLSVGKAGGKPDESPVGAHDNGDGTLSLENEHLRVAFTLDGEISSLIHWIGNDDDGWTEREVVAEQKMLNALSGGATFERMAIVENGPVRAAIEVIRNVGGAKIAQRISLCAGSPRLDFATKIERAEPGPMVFASFPVAVLSSRWSHEIAFGHVERPTFAPDSEEFFVAARWADLSEGDYGVSVLSDGACVCRVDDDTLKLLLLAENETGTHSLTYSLLPHTGDFRNETHDAALALNFPLVARFAPANESGTLSPTFTLASVDDQGLVIESVQPSSDLVDTLIVTVWEAFQTRGRANLSFGFAVESATVIDPSSGGETPVDVENDAIAFDYKPFEILTFLIHAANPTA